MEIIERVCYKPTIEEALGYVKKYEQEREKDNEQTLNE